MAGRADGFLAAVSAGRVEQDDCVAEVGAGPGAQPEVRAGEFVQGRAGQFGTPGRGQRTVFLPEAEREDQLDGESGSEGRLGGERVHAGLAAGQDAAPGAGRGRFARAGRAVARTRSRAAGLSLPGASGYL